MMTLRNLLGAALLAILAGCPATSLGTGKAPTTAIPDSLNLSGLPGPIDAATSDRYYPLDRFFSWTYAVSIVSGGATTSAEDTVRIETLSAGTTRSGTLSIKRFVGGTLVFDRPGTLSVSPTEISLSREGNAEIIKLPLKTGNEWTSGTLTARSLKVETLEVGAKTYSDLIGIAYSRDGEVVAVRWLAPGAGIVKQLTRSKADGAVVETTSELLSSKTVAVSKVTLSPAASFSLTPTATAEISAIVAMAEDGLYSQDIAFSSSNTTIATVTKGASTPSGLKATVTAIGTGSVTITAKSDQDPTKLASLSVEVN